VFSNVVKEFPLRHSSHSSIPSITSLKYSQYLKSLSDKLKTNPKKFWSFHSIKSKTKRLPEVLTSTGKSKSVKDPVDKASLLNKFFSSVFSTRALDSVVSLHVDAVNPNQLMDVSTTRNEVKIGWFQCCLHLFVTIIYLFLGNTARKKSHLSCLGHQLADIVQKVTSPNRG